MKHNTETQWLSVIGVGENGVEGLCAAAQRAVAEAALVVGGERHITLLSALIQGKTRLWPSPLETIMPELLAMHPQPVCVLASGDPFCYGVGSVLTRHIPVEQMRVFPAPSAFSLAAARLGWPLQEVVTIGLNARPLERIIPYLQPGARIIALMTDETTPQKLATLLTQRGLGDARFTVLERLGGEHERIRRCTAENFVWHDVARLNCVAIEIAEDAHAKTRALPLTVGLEDERFEHDGQLTKQEIRAVTLSALAPRAGELLWDIGLGAGSIAIEWLRAHPANRAIGFEKNSERAARAARNAAALGAPDLHIIECEAPAALVDAEAPDAVFIGGGGGNPAVIETAWDALKPGGRLVVNAIALETEAGLIAAHKRYGGSLIRIGVERAEPVGSMTGWRPAMRVMQWRVCK